MIGLGTQDDLRQAQSFLTKHQISSVKLLWDATGTSWVKLNVAAQPAWMLIAADGTVKRTTFGAIPYDDILKSL